MQKLIAQRIKELEISQHIDCYAAADIGDFSVSTATALLNGNANPTVNLLKKVCIGFGITIHKFFDSEIFDCPQEKND